MDNHPDITPGEIDEDPDNPNKDDMPFPWIIACEDLGGTDDYDFNDIVFGVEHIAGEREVYVTALAAGGTLPTYLYYKDHQIVGGVKETYDKNKFGQYTYYSPDTNKKTFKEWHEWFGSQYYHTSMINTKDSESFKVGATVVLVLPEDEAKTFSMSNTATPSINVENNSLGGFSLKVTQTDGDFAINAPIVNREDGTITGDIFPQMFATTPNYKWPTERTPIYSTHFGDKDKGEIKTFTINGKSYVAYKNSFHDWVLNNNDEFHKLKPTSNVITHNWKGSINKITSN